MKQWRWQNVQLARVRRASLSKHTHLPDYCPPSKARVEEWKKEYQEEMHRRPEEKMDSEEPRERSESPLNRTQYGQGRRSHSSCKADLEKPGVISTEKLLAEMHEFTRDIDKSLQELKEGMDQMDKGLKEGVKEKETQQQQTGRCRQQKTFTVDVEIKGKMKTCVVLSCTSRGH